MLRVSTAILSLNNYNLHASTNKSHSKHFSTHRSHHRSRYSLLNSTTKQFSTASDDKTTKPEVLHDKKSSIEDFRAREEQRDEEYSTQNTSSNGEEKNDEKIQEIRSKIMDAALPFVSNFGWSRETISKGAESIGYPGIVHGMFPNGGIELVHYFYSRCNQQLIEQMKSDLDTTKNQNPAEFATRAVQFRLRLIEPYLTHWPQALGLMSLPPNVPTSLAHLLTLVDDICFYAGDRSVDVCFVSYKCNLWKIIFFFKFSSVGILVE